MPNLATLELGTRLPGISGLPLAWGEALRHGPGVLLIAVIWLMVILVGVAAVGRRREVGVVGEPLGVVDGHLWASAAIMFLCAYLVCAALPLTPRVFAGEMPFGLCYAIALGAASIHSILMRLPGPNDKYGATRSFRSLALVFGSQSIMGVALMGAVMATGTLSLRAIVHGELGQDGAQLFSGTPLRGFAGGEITILSWLVMTQPLGALACLLACVVTRREDPSWATAWQGGPLQRAAWVALSGVPVALLVLVFLGGWTSPVMEPWATSALGEASPTLVAWHLFWFSAKVCGVGFLVAHGQSDTGWVRRWSRGAGIAWIAGWLLLGLVVTAASVSLGVPRALLAVAGWLMLVPVIALQPRADLVVGRSRAG